MPNVTTGSTAIPFGTNLRIGYRVSGSTVAYTYITHYPSYDELPYTFPLPLQGEYQIEYTTVCPNCAGNIYSEPETTIVTVT